MTCIVEPNKERVLIAGEIFIDRYNIKDLDLKFLRRNIGAVSQEPSLFTGTIKDNLKVGKMDADDREIQKATKMSNAHSFISQLPDQYQTEVNYLISFPLFYPILPCLFHFNTKFPIVGIFCPNPNS